MKTFADGVRVRVNIKDPTTWATGAAEKMQGHVGIVQRTSHTHGVPPSTAALVNFVEPLPEKHWGPKGQTVAAHWFETGELEAVE